MSDLPQSQRMRPWQYQSVLCKFGIEVRFHPSAPVPQLQPNEHLVRVLFAAVNPVPYRPARLRIDRLLLVPCNELCGIIVTPAAISAFKPGQIAWGNKGNFVIAGAAFAEYAILNASAPPALPKNLNMEPAEAALMMVVGLVYYPFITKRLGDDARVFINGGSSLMGAQAIKMAKGSGYHATTYSPLAHVKFCKSLGATTTQSSMQGKPLLQVTAQVVSSRQPFDHVIDTSGNARELYWHCLEYSKPGAEFVIVSKDLAIGSSWGRCKLRMYMRNPEELWPLPKLKDMKQISKWVKEGKLKPVMRSRFAFEDTREDRVKTLMSFMSSGAQVNLAMVVWPDGRESIEERRE